MNVKYLCLFILLLFGLAACHSDKTNIRKRMYLTSIKDTLKQEATSFLLDNMADQISEIPIFRKWMFGHFIDIRMDTITNDSSLIKIIRDRHLKYSTRALPDDGLVSDSLLMEHIDLAIQSLSESPWAKDIPKDIFLNYLLPYKVFGEQPAHWRSFFHEKYKPYFENDEGVYQLSLDDLYYKIIVDDVGKWYHYAPQPFRIARYPGFDEIMAVKNGECYKWGYLNVYILRSIGIPAALDFIPQWGSMNSGHASEVFWDNELGKFRTARGRGFKLPAKVFRYSFENQKIWTDSIMPVTGKNFHLAHLKHNHWTDVTNDHTVTADITYALPAPNPTGFAYICVFNYGAWKPVFWGRMVDESRTRFRDMGCRMLYRVATPKGYDYRLVDDIFMLDSIGNIVRFVADTTLRQSMMLTKINHGERAWIKKGMNYSLYYLGNNAVWNHLKTLTCDRDSLVIFENVPVNGLYRLLEDGGKTGLERIFTYQEKQIWY